MTEENDIDGLAAEYVLGSLDPAERRQVDERRRTDAALAAAIAAWERRLGPLARQTPGVAPPAHVADATFSRIARQAAQPTARVVSLPRRATRRRRLAIAAGALAACLALAAGWFFYEHSDHSDAPLTHVSAMDCSSQYKNFWGTFDRGRYAAISAERLAGVSRMALRAYDACQAGDEQDAQSLFRNLQQAN